MADFSHQYKSLLSSPLGKDLIAELTKLAESTTASARDEKSLDSAFGLLKESGGVIKAIGHLQFLSVVPEDEGGQNN